MNSFLNYLDQNIPLELRLKEAFDTVRIPADRRREITSFLEVLKIKDAQSYNHSVRVGLLTLKIAEFMHLSRRALLYAGLLHDIGKTQTRPELLRKTGEWTKSDAEELNSHVMDGYRIIRGHFDFSAEIILWHHRFQPRMYPEKLPKFLHSYSQGTRIMIPLFGRMLSLADVFDALHRLNSKSDKIQQITGELIKEKMLTFNKDQETLINELYETGIFTTDIYNE